MSRRYFHNIALALLCSLLCVGCVPTTTWQYVDYDEKSAVDFSHYPTAEAVSAFLESLADSYPHLVLREIIGDSLRGKPISALTITNNPTGNHLERPALLVIAQQHAREPISSQLALYWMQQLLESYGKDEIATHLLDTRTLYVIPQVNPDGNDVFIHADNQLRSNLRPSDLDGDGLYDEDPREGLGIHSYQSRLVYLKGAWARSGDPFRMGWNRFNEGKPVNYVFSRHLGWVDYQGESIKQVDNDADGKTNEDGYLGVDLNRNWDIAWLEGDASPNIMTNKGAQPWSEPEMQAVRDFIMDRPNILIGVDLHSGVDMILYPWSMTRETPPDEEVLKTLAQMGTTLTESPHSMGSEGLYLAYGTSKDWLYSQGILSLTAEVFGASDVAGYKRLWPFQAYLTIHSQAHRFNPPPQDIQTITQRWSPYLDFLLSALPSTSLTSYGIVSKDEIELVFSSTGYLSPSFNVLRDDQATEHSAIAGAHDYSITLELQNDESLRLSLAYDSLVQITNRPSPTATFLIRRENDTLFIE